MPVSTAPFNAGRGAEQANEEFVASCGVPETDMAGPPSAEAICVEPDWSSPGQYATGMRLPVNRTFARYSGAVERRLDAAETAQQPGGLDDVDVDVPAGRVPVCGHAATSPWNRYFRLEISPVPPRVHVFDCASVNEVAPAVWAVKSGLA